ncbi:MAG: FtsW/RodA/SpoVE family cell cycle protein [Clostridiales bacterium]|nr:FtsW/RodA/SpoVE family cell cycle protein [Clostridiales bacterium]
MFDKNNLRHIDFLLLGLVTFLVFCGIIMIGSADGWYLDQEHFSLDPMMKRQILGFIIGLVAIFFILLLNYDKLKLFVIPLYIGVFLLLVAVLFIGVGSEADGDDVRRWIQLPAGFTLQPSEFAKIAIIMFMAWFLNLYQDRINNFMIIAVLGVLVVIPLFLIYKEPDLSTSIVVVSIVFFMALNGNVGWRYIIPAVIIGTLLVVLVYTDAMSDHPRLLGYYQVMRIKAWRHPEDYRLGEAFQTIQSTNAVGSGGLLGVGLFHSSGTVPVATTDFIFGIIGEELGFVGAIGFITLLLLVFIRIIIIAQRAGDFFGRLLCIGIAVSFIFQSAIHIGVCTGMLPNTGIPLPFVSYGSSSLIASMIGIGLVLKVESEARMV